MCSHEASMSRRHGRRTRSQSVTPSGLQMSVTPAKGLQMSVTPRRGLRRRFRMNLRSTIMVLIVTTMSVQAMDGESLILNAKTNSLVQNFKNSFMKLLGSETNGDAIAVQVGRVVDVCVKGALKGSRDSLVETIANELAKTNNQTADSIVDMLKNGLQQYNEMPNNQPLIKTSFERFFDENIDTTGIEALIQIKDNIGELVDMSVENALNSVITQIAEKQQVPRMLIVMALDYKITLKDALRFHEMRYPGEYMTVERALNRLEMILPTEQQMPRILIVWALDCQISLEVALHIHKVVMVQLGADFFKPKGVATLSDEILTFVSNNGLGLIMIMWDTYKMNLESAFQKWKLRTSGGIMS